MNTQKTPRPTKYVVWCEECNAPIINDNETYWQVFRRNKNNCKSIAHNYCDKCYKGQKSEI